MATINRFEDLKVWQKARQLCSDIHSGIKSSEMFSKDFQLKDQISRSSGSVMDNIAEGFGRLGNSEFINFLSIAKGSLLEVASQLYRALDRNYIAKDQLNKYLILIGEINKMLNAMINYLAKSDFRGQKFKVREKN